MTTPPSVNNYQIPTGRVYFKKDGGSIRELGNCTEFKLTSDIQTKDHFRNYGGSRTKDVTTITSKGVTVSFGMEELVGENLEMWALADSTTDTDGNIVLSGLSNTQFQGVLTVVGDNDAGPRISWEGTVKFIPSGDFFLIKNDDEYNVLTVTATVQDDGSGNFGVWTITPQA